MKKELLEDSELEYEEGRTGYTSTHSAGSYSRQMSDDNIDEHETRSPS